MIILDNYNKTLNAKLTLAPSTNNLVFTTSWREVNLPCGITNAAWIKNDNEGFISTNTLTQIILPPTQNTPKNTYWNEVEYVSIYNADTASATVEIIVQELSTSYTMLTISLPPNYQLIYNRED